LAIAVPAGGASHKWMSIVANIFFNGYPISAWVFDVGVSYSRDNCILISKAAEQGNVW